MSIATMYAAKAGSPKTTLAAALAAADTSMTLTDASVLPSAPNLAVIGSDSDAEVVSYSAVTGNAVSGMVRGLGGTTASAWDAGEEVARNITSLDHNTFKANIEDLDSRMIADAGSDGFLYGRKNGAWAKAAGRTVTSKTYTVAASGGDFTSIQAAVDAVGVDEYAEIQVTSVTSSTAGATIANKNIVLTIKSDVTIGKLAFKNSKSKISLEANLTISNASWSVFDIENSMLYIIGNNTSNYWTLSALNATNCCINATTAFIYAQYTNFVFSSTTRAILLGGSLFAHHSGTLSYANDSGAGKIGLFVGYSIALVNSAFTNAGTPASLSCGMYKVGSSTPIWS